MFNRTYYDTYGEAIKLIWRIFIKRLYICVMYNESQLFQEILNAKKK